MYLLLYLLWLILNGHITVEIAFWGVVVVGMIGLFCRFLLQYSLKSELWLYRKSPIFFAFFAVLFWEILKANFVVITIILSKKRKIIPTLVEIPVDFKTKFAKFLFANSITLTPGTITMNAEGNCFTVHCLHRDLLDTSSDSLLIRLLKRLEA